MARAPVILSATPSHATPPHTHTFPRDSLSQAVAADPQLHAMTVMAVEAAAAAAMAPEGPPALAPSLVAAACLAHARGRLGMTPVWPEALQAMTAYAAEDLIPAAQAVEAATAAAATQGLA